MDSQIRVGVIGERAMRILSSILTIVLLRGWAKGDSGIVRPQASPHRTISASGELEIGMYGSGRGRRGAVVSSPVKIIPGA